MTSQRALVWILRLAGIFEILAFFAVVMPTSWMAASHSWLGMGDFPEGPLLMFMIRQASYAYGMHGVSLCLLATDIQRYRLLILLNGISFSLAGVIFFLIDYTSGMPLWWTIFDSLGCGFTGIAILWLSHRAAD